LVGGNHERGYLRYLARVRGTGYTVVMETHKTKLESARTIDKAIREMEANLAGRAAELAAKYLVKVVGLKGGN
jgi:hypothetical protein